MAFASPQMGDGLGLIAVGQLDCAGVVAVAGVAETFGVLAAAESQAGRVSCCRCRASARPRSITAKSGPAMADSEARREAAPHRASRADFIRKLRRVGKTMPRMIRSFRHSVQDRIVIRAIGWANSWR
ncbi:hypothetical protein Rmet_4080 (plasmid) [Cupriavidus metallidurans CH34]|uniref:Uncharacterized protein n=1 Tax=Cupriavidus metallidurans (strain ATCC 43123 / DSM 2839 / NBRC 102507 / CH34) TaxID=266264 RepID=Q1LFX9_CUPMC|nr:hypothetical protein Rmet_4080 [Cupriavidus metallidurans CH34]